MTGFQETLYFKSAHVAFATRNQLTSAPIWPQCAHWVRSDGAARNLRCSDISSEIQPLRRAAVAQLTYPHTSQHSPLKFQTLSTPQATYAAPPAPNKLTTAYRRNAQRLCYPETCPCLTDNYGTTSLSCAARHTQSAVQVLSD
jgi:hypothetical protein